MRKHLTKFRLLSVLLTVALMLSLIPATALAAGDHPELLSADVTSTGDLELTFDMAMADPSGNESAFTVRRNDGVTNNVTAAQLKSGESTIIELTLTSKIKGGYVFDILYDTGTVQSSDGKMLEPVSFYSITNDLPHPTITSGAPPAGTLGVAYSHTFAASGGIGPYSYSKYSGNLPYGLTLNSGVLSGTPNTYSGTYIFKIRVTDANGAIDVKQYSITTTPPADTTPPAFVEGYPQAVPMGTGTREIQVNIQAQEEAYYYFVLLPDNAVPPDSQEVVAGTDGDGNSVLRAVYSGAKYTSDALIISAPMHNTPYDVYVVLKDDAENLSEPEKAEVTTPPAADFFAGGYPALGAAQAPGSKNVQILVNMQNTQSDAKIYYVLVTDGANAPGINQIVSGKDSMGANALAAGTATFPTGSESSFTVTGPVDGTAYDLYMVAGDTHYSPAYNVCTDVEKLDVTTPPAVLTGNTYEVASNGTKYDTLAAAVAAADSTDTITLLVDNVTDTTPVVVNGKDITLDLDGKTLTLDTSTLTNTTALSVQDGGRLSLASGEGAFNVIANSNSTAVSADGDAYDSGTIAPASVTVTNVTGGSGVHASNQSIITVRGDATATNSNNGTAAYSTSGSTVTVGGSATGQFGAYALGANSSVSVTGNITATGVSIAKYAIAASGMNAKATVNGNVTAEGSTGAYAAGGGEVQIEGTLTANQYVKLENTVKTAAEYEQSQITGVTKTGYRTYYDASSGSKVWIKVATGAPTVVTDPIITITPFGAQLSGSVTSDGGSPVTERGFVYGLSASPSTVTGTKVISGSGTGSFAETLSGLAANTTYHVRAYAINSNGEGYGENRQFTTLGSGGDPVTPGVLGDPHDGVDFTALTTQGNGIYYGTYKHRLSSSSVESVATPILWLIMGVESSDADFITVMSRYLLDTRAFHSSWANGDNEYNRSDIRDWLNSFGSYASNGFLNSFSAPEQEGMGSPGTETGLYTNLGNEITGTHGSQTQSFPITSSQDQVYLPWGRFGGLLHWTAGNDISEGQIPESLRIAFWKGGSLGQTWWLRSPHYSDAASALRVEPGGHTGFGNVGNNHEIRPVFKLDADNVIFASEIGGTGVGATPVVAGEYAQAASGKNYKLTILDTGLTLTGLQADGQTVSASVHPVISAASGGDIAIAGTSAAGTNITYKIVRDNGTSREIVGYGQGDGTGVTVTAEDLARNNLAFGNYTVYVWAQQNEAKSSNTGSTPQYFTLSVTDTTAPTITTVTPAQNATDVAISGNIIITFDEAITTTGTVSLDHGIGTLTGTSGWSNGGKTYTIAYSGLAYNTGYTITIAGFEDAAGNPMANGSYSFTTLSVVPTAPQSFSATPGDRQVALTWSAPASDGGSAIIRYEVSSNNGSTWVTAGSNTSHTFTGLTNSQSYTFKVRAVNAEGNGPETSTTAAPRSSGGSTGGGGPSTPPASSVTPLDAEVLDSGGNINSSIPASLDSSTGIVTAKADQDSLNDAFEDSEADAAGVKTIGIDIPEVSGAAAYASTLPASFLSSGDASRAVELQTALASVTVPGNMLAEDNASGAQDVTLTIAAGNKSKLDPAVQARIGDRPLIQLTLTVDGRQTSWSNENAPVTVTIPYTPTAEELTNPESIVIWYIDGAGNAVPVPNGRYDSTIGTVTFTTTHFSDYAVGYNKVTFSDVAADAWYSKAVAFIAAREITGGTGGGNYSPDAKLTRGEFIVMLMKAYDIAPDAKDPANFADAGNTWYTGYLAAAKRLGITAGIGSNLFAPEKEITRQDMFTLLYNTLKTLGKLPEGTAGKPLSAFSDAGDIDSWAQDAMALLTETGIISGSYGRLLPTATTTRAELAQVLYNLLAK